MKIHLHFPKLLLLVIFLLNLSFEGKTQDNQIESKNLAEIFTGKKEVFSKRDVNSKHFLNEDGSFTAIISNGPLHYERDGQFLDIDLNVIQTNNEHYAYANTSNLFESYFGSSAHKGVMNKNSNGELVEFLNTNMYWEVNGQPTSKLISSNVTAMVQDNKVYYPNLYGNISAEFSILTGKRKLNYIIPNIDDLGTVPANAKYLVFSEDIILPQGWKYSSEDDGIYIFDEYGNNIYQYEMPVSMDASGENFTEQNTIFETSLIGYTLTIKTKVLTEWLLNTERQYPVTVDPTINIPVNNANNHTGTLITRRLVDTWTISYIHDSFLRVGRGSDDYILWVVPWRANYYDAYMQFDLSSVPSLSSITTSNLRVYRTFNYGSDIGTYNIVTSSYNISDPSGNAFPSPQVLSGNITSILTEGGNGYKTASFNQDGRNYLNNVIADMNNSDIIQIGLKGTNFGRSENNYLTLGNHTVSTRPTLIIEYREPIQLNCNGTFTDTGGVSAHYENNENYFWVASPNNPSIETVQVTFTNFRTQSGDILRVYDGPDNSFPQIASLEGDLINNLPGPFISTHPSGKLTFRFTSNSTGTYPGWSASISCIPKEEPGEEDCNVNNLQSAFDVAYQAGGSDQRLAVDLMVDANTMFSLNGIEVYFWKNLTANFSDFNVIVYGSTANLPNEGNIVNTQSVTPTNISLIGAMTVSEESGNVYKLTLPINPIILNGGTADTKYWISVTGSVTDGVARWLRNNNIISSNFAFKNSGNIWYLSQENDELSYKFIGECYSGYIYVNDTEGWRPNNPDGSDGTASVATDDIRVLEGTANFSNTVVANNLTVNAGANLNIENVLRLVGDLENNGLITFKSNATQTGQFDKFYGDITGTGEFTTEKYMPARRAFRLFSAPITTTGGSKPSIRDNWQEGVNNTGTNPAQNQNPNPGYGTHITGSKTGLNGFDATPSGNASLFGYVNATQTWFNIGNTNSTTYAAGQPWRLMVRGGRDINVNSNSSAPTPTTLRTTGSLSYGNKVQSQLSTNIGQDNFIGNPYQAAVDMNKVLAEATNVNSTYYLIWDPMLGGDPTPGEPGGRGAFVTVSLPSGTNTSESTANQYLQPGEAFFVFNSGNSPSITFKEDHKEVIGFHNKTMQTEFSKINVLLYGKSAFETGATASDGVLVLFSEEGDNEITYKDAPKFSNLDENLSTYTDGNRISIEDRAYPTNDDIINLYIDEYRHSEYVFKVITENIPENTRAYLHDKMNDSYIELDEEVVSYGFVIDSASEASIDPTRFEIVFKVEEDEEVMDLNDELASAIELYPNPVDKNEFTISSKSFAGKTLQVTVTNMIGQNIIDKVYDVPSTGKIIVYLPASTATGAYNVRLIEGGKRLMSKKIIKK